VDPVILAALITCNGSRVRAAAALSIPLRTLYRRLAGHGDELAQLAAAHRWPSQTEAATRASAARYGAGDEARRAKNAQRMREARNRLRGAAHTSRQSSV